MITNMPENAQHAFIELQGMGCPVVNKLWTGHFQIELACPEQGIWASLRKAGNDGMDAFGIGQKISQVLQKHELDCEVVTLL